MDPKALSPEERGASAVLDVPPAATLEESYLHLLKLCITGLVSPQPVSAELGANGRVVYPMPVDLDERIEGSDHPLDAYTTIGWRRLDNVHRCVADAMTNGVPGDLIETGAWRGGVTIFMRAFLKVREARDRVVFAADPFGALPTPDRSPIEEGSRFGPSGLLNASIEHVRENFRRFGLLDDQVQFVEGLLEDTLPTLRDRSWSVVRIGGPGHESTLMSLENLYPNLSPGGYVMIDGYGADEACRRGVDDFRDRKRIDDEIRPVDGTGVYWQRAAGNR